MKNIPIIGKFAVIMAAFGVFTVGVSVYAGAQINRIDTTYTSLLKHESTAALNLSRMNRAFQTARAALSELVSSNKADARAASIAEYAEARKALAEFADTADAAMAGDDAIKSVKASALSLFETKCEEAFQTAQAAKSEMDVRNAHSLYAINCQPNFAGVMQQIVSLSTERMKAADQKSDLLSLETSSVVFNTIATVLGGLAVVLAAGFFAIRSWLVQPINALAGTMRQLAGGDLATNVGGTDRRDEVGRMAQAVQVFKDNGLRALELEREAGTQRDLSEADRARNAEIERARAAAMAEATDGLGNGLKHLAAGDLTFVLDRPFAPDFEGLRNDFNTSVAQLADVLRDISRSAGSIDGGTREISASADDLSRRTEQQAASLEETAAALDEITANVGNSSQRAEEARAVARVANDSAAKSGQVVASAVNAMQRIEQSSSQISNIIGVIDEIAFQTNLLALNAGVEAARAGEAGKGFAVVAQEVRELAQRSAQAAKEIKELIRNSSVEVEGGVKYVRETGEALKAIEAHVVTINQHMEAIATSAREQSTGLAEVNTAVNQMDQVTQQNAAMVEESNAASAALASEAAHMRDLIARFRLDQAAGTRSQDFEYRRAG